MIYNDLALRMLKDRSVKITNKILFNLLNHVLNYCDLYATFSKYDVNYANFTP